MGTIIKWKCMQICQSNVLGNINEKVFCILICMIGLIFLEVLDLLYFLDLFYFLELDLIYLLNLIYLMFDLQ